MRVNVHLVHLIFVIQTPTVLRLHLTCVPVTQPAVTGVNAITDTLEMDSPAQASYNCSEYDDICHLHQILFYESCLNYVRDDCSLWDKSISIQLDCIIIIRNPAIYITKKP